ncbi:MAG TPA: hypothetical protein VJM34_10310 [Novosphingobium sp.]|nr:hypothetical protein [Novosphingobium sp.]
MEDRPSVGEDKIVAISLLNAQELNEVGARLKHLFPVTNDGMFDDLLKRLDKASTAGRWRCR